MHRTELQLVNDNHVTINIVYVIRSIFYYKRHTHKMTLIEHIHIEIVNLYLISYILPTFCGRLYIQLPLAKWVLIYIIKF